MRGEAGCPQHPKWIVAEGLLRGSWGTEHSVDQIGAAAVRIGEVVLRQAHGHRVDGEVAAAQVIKEVRAVPDDRVATHAVVLVGAVGGDLQAHSLALRADGAEAATGFPAGLGPALEHGERLVRMRARGEVQVVAKPADQGVAHRATDQVELMAGSIEPPAQFVGDGVDAQDVREHAALVGGGLTAAAGRASAVGIGADRTGHRDASLSGPGGRVAGDLPVLMITTGRPWPPSSMITELSTPAWGSNPP